MGKRPNTPLWAARLKVAFESAGITDKRGKIDKKELGRLFNVDPKTIESWTTGRTQPRFEVLMRPRETTGFSLDWILSDEPGGAMIREGQAETTPAKKYRRHS